MSTFGVPSSTVICFPLGRRAFLQFSFTFAFPSMQKNRPVKPPLSLIKVDKKINKEIGEKAGKEVYDVALCGGPVLINDMAQEIEKK